MNINKNKQTILKCIEQCEYEERNWRYIYEKQYRGEGIKCEASKEGGGGFSCFRLSTVECRVWSELDGVT